jgi:hypothetical protein
MDIGESKIPSRVSKHQLLMIESEEVENGCVKVMHVHGVLYGAESESICLAIGQPSSDSASRHPHREAVVIVVSAVDFSGVGAGQGEFDHGGPAEFSAKEDQRILEHAALFEVGEKRTERLVAVFGEFAVVDLDVIVAVPGLAWPVPDLDKPNPAFKEPACREALAAVDSRAIKVPDVRGLSLDIESIGRLNLHPEGEFKGLDAGLKGRICVPRSGMKTVE